MKSIQEYIIPLGENKKLLKELLKKLPENTFAHNYFPETKEEITAKLDKQNRVILNLKSPTKSKRDLNFFAENESSRMIYFECKEYRHFQFGYSGTMFEIRIPIK